MAFPKIGVWNLSLETKCKYYGVLKTFENSFFLISTDIILVESAFFWRKFRKTAFSDNLGPKI